MAKLGSHEQVLLDTGVMHKVRHSRMAALYPTVIHHGEPPALAVAIYRLARTETFRLPVMMTPGMLLTVLDIDDDEAEMREVLNTLLKATAKANTEDEILDIVSTLPFVL